MTSQQKEIVHRLLDDVWSQGDAAAAAALIAERYTIFHDPGDPWHGRVLDRNGYRDRLLTSRAPFPDQRFAAQAMIEEGNAVAVTWLWTATHLGDIPGFPASGKTITMSGATLYTFTHGLVDGHWQITDRLGVFRQLSR